MQKLNRLRQAITDACPDLGRDPDRLLIFAEQGKLVKKNLLAGLSFEYQYKATLLVTDFGADPDTLLIPILAWCQKNQPDMTEQVSFEADILNNTDVDLVVTIPLTEFVKVTDNGDGTVSAAHLPEPIYIGDNGEQSLPATPEWETYPDKQIIT